MRNRLGLLLILICICCFEGKCKSKNDYKIVQRFNIDLVESSFPVGFAQEIAKNHQYIAYYDKDKNLCVGARKLNQKKFTKTILNSKIEWDSHNYVDMIVDDNGYIHISGNMHCSNLKYWRSKRPYDASEFDEINYMTGKEENSVTYPHFMKLKSGELLFHYRHGGSGHGLEIYNKWNPDTKSWSRFLDKPLIDGKGIRNAYMTGPLYGPDKYYHLYWVWRESPDCATNHTLSYARSSDMIHWENVKGEPLTSPILFSDEKVIVDKSEKMYGTGMLNGVQKHTFDSQNRIVICNMKYDRNGNSQLYLYRFNNNKWEEKCITNWNYRFDFSGWGSMVFEITLKDMRNIGDGKIGVTYNHSKYGEKEIVVDENTLQPVSENDFLPSYPSELDKVKTEGTYNKDVIVHILRLGNYIMRWETLDANNDKKPEYNIPAPYMLEMIEIKKK